METIKNIVKNIFASDPGPDFNYYLPLLVLAILLIIWGVVFSGIYDRKKKTDFAFKRCFKNLSKTMVLFGCLFLLLLAVRYEGIPYFSMRLWLYTSTLIFLYLVYHYVMVYIGKYTKEKTNSSVLQKDYLENKKISYSPSKKKKH
ncbi:hypothetical protein HY604_03100 [Candidatus Peregrinibacteria bacterium]|nr:hypothetical protein [Candidatus Peregrinibacteria bacterium]